jgi:hypothetical protein
VNWYKLETVRDTLRLDYGAELAPSIVRKQGPNLEVWRRRVGAHVFTAFLNYESDELLVPEEQILAAADGLNVDSPSGFLEKIRARGGLWTGPSPRGV